MSKACYCKDTNTYSIECCDDTLWAQGIGRTQATGQIIPDNFLAKEVGDLILKEDLTKIIV